MFLSLPFAPLFTFIVLVFQYLSFKFEKLMLFKYGAKPKKEWKAQDAGGFFIKFYLITIIVTGILAVYLFLSGETFAKNFELLNATTTCKDLGYRYWDPSSDDWMDVDGAGSCTSYNETVMRSIASRQCGPFVEEVSAWSMVEEDIEDGKLSTISAVVYQIAVNAGVVWFIVLSFYLRLNFTESTLGVAETSIDEKERAFEMANQAAETKIKRLTKRVKNLEAAAKT